MKRIFTLLALTAAINFAFAQENPKTNDNKCIKKCNKACAKDCKSENKGCKEKKACCKK